MIIKKKKIFRLHKNLDYVGYGSLIQDELLGECIIITDCYNIRDWGTSNGIGELQIRGKMKGTILDRCLPVRVKVIEIHNTMDIDPLVQDTFKND